MSEEKKVIIVGGGIAGLTLAIALEHANINYLLLESHEFAPQVGASVIIWGGGLRIADQLGIKEAIENVACATTQLKYMYEDGTLIKECDLFVKVTEQTGYPLLALERKELMEVLYNAVKDKSKCLALTRVLDYEEDEKGVSVKCSDGTTYTGDLLIGADGINSKVRELMLEKIAKERGDDKLVPGFATQFSCVFGISENVPELPAGKVFNIHGNGRSFMFTVANNGRVFFFLYESIPSTSIIPRYTEEDAIKSMESASNIQIANRVSSGDVYKKRKIAVKVALEEGVCHTMFFKRACLIGDSLHKTTPNDGFGGMMAMESAVYIANEIKKAFDTHEGKNIPTNILEDSFNSYATKHRERAIKEVSDSGISSRMQAGTGILYRMARYTLLPNVPVSLLTTIVVKRHQPSPVLDYLPKPQHKGLSKYHDEIPK